MSAVGVFVLGLYIGVGVFASLARVIDVWFAIRDQWRQVLWRLVRTGAVVLVLIWLIDTDLESVFFNGVGCYFVLHFLVYALARVQLMVSARR